MQNLTLGQTTHWNLNVHSRSKYHANRGSDIWDTAYFRATPVQSGKPDNVNDHFLLGSKQVVSSVTTTRLTASNRRFFKYTMNGNAPDIQKLRPGYYTLELLGTSSHTIINVAGKLVVATAPFTTVVDDGLNASSNPVLYTTQLFVQDPAVENVVETTTPMATVNEQDVPVILFPEL